MTRKRYLLIRRLLILWLCARNRWGRCFMRPLIETHANVIERGAIGVDWGPVSPKYSEIVWREVQHLPKRYFLFPDHFLGCLTFGDIGHRPDNFDVAG